MQALAGFVTFISWIVSKSAPESGCLAPIPLDVSRPPHGQPSDVRGNDYGSGFA